MKDWHVESKGMIYKKKDICKCVQWWNPPLKWSHMITQGNPGYSLDFSKPRVFLADYFCIPPSLMRILRVTQGYPEYFPSFGAISSKTLGISNSRVYPRYLKLYICLNEPT